jgi:hypothetical protein
MTRARIDRFLVILAREPGVPGRVYVTGATRFTGSTAPRG